jgi:uncharacterized protein YjiS (DUF1127 family)
MEITALLPAAAPAGPKRFAAVGRALRELALYLVGSPLSRRRQAEALAALDDRLLADIGLTRTDGTSR